MWHYRNRLKLFLRYVSISLATLVTFLLTIIFITGDFDLTNYLITSAEARAYKNHNTIIDKIGLRLLYNSMIISSQFQYPQASKFLYHYIHSHGDTLFFDAKTLLENTEIKQAIALNKKGIVFKSGLEINRSFYFVKQTNEDLYFAFDVLYIRKTKDKIIFYDNYYFQPLEKRTRPLFKIGKIRFRLNDGLIKVAYPDAKPFVAYAEITKD